MDNDIVITSLWYREKLSKKGSVPYLHVNCTFRVKEGFSKNDALSLCSPCFKTLVADTESEALNFKNTKLAWVLKDQSWAYLPKFDTFWFSELVSDCSVTRSCIYDLQYYKDWGEMPDVHRFADDRVILRHLQTLHSYWD